MGILFAIGAATLFAIGLLASGQVWSGFMISPHKTNSKLWQSASLIATIAGQAVAEGFIQWRTSVSQFTR